MRAKNGQIQPGFCGDESRAGWGVPVARGRGFRSRRSDRDIASPFSSLPLARRARMARRSPPPGSWHRHCLQFASMVGQWELAQVGLADSFHAVKPHPALYSLSIQRLGVPATQALALEDSPHGISATAAAGPRCIAIPGPMTKEQALSGADIQLGSLAERSLGSVRCELWPSQSRAIVKRSASSSMPPSPALHPQGPRRPHSPTFYWCVTGLPNSVNGIFSIFAPFSPPSG